jgi:hypothetical protein
VRGNPRPEPRPIAFMTWGYSAAEGLDILERWETLSNDQMAELGLTDFSAEEAPLSATTFGRSVH